MPRKWWISPVVVGLPGEGIDHPFVVEVLYGNGLFTCAKCRIVCLGSPPALQTVDLTLLYHVAIEDSPTQSVVTYVGAPHLRYKRWIYQRWLAPLWRALTIHLLLR